MQGMDQSNETLLKPEISTGMCQDGDRDRTREEEVREKQRAADWSSRENNVNFHKSVEKLLLNVFC